MNYIENIRFSLMNNPNLTEDVKNKLYSLIQILIKKIPEINLLKLNEKVSTLKILKMSKFERRGTYFYDVRKNEIFFSNRLEGNYDIDHLLIKGLLEMSTSTNKYTGFNSDERLMALNCAYTEMLANFVIGNEGESDLEEEMLITNLLSYIIGKDVLYNAYFTNNGEPVLKALEEAEVGII